MINIIWLTQKQLYGTFQKCMRLNDHCQGRLDKVIGNPDSFKGFTNLLLPLYQMNVIHWKPFGLLLLLCNLFKHILIILSSPSVGCVPHFLHCLLLFLTHNSHYFLHITLVHSCFSIHLSQLMKLHLSHCWSHRQFYQKTREAR